MTVHLGRTRYLSLCLLTLFSTALSAGEMQYPLDVLEVDQQTAYVADRNLPGIWKIQDGKAELYFQGSKKFRTPLNAVRCLALDEKQRLLAGDSATREIYRFDENQTPVPLTNGKIGIPMAIAVAKSGDIFVADLELHRIWKVPSAGGKPKEIAVVPAPRGMSIDADGQLWIVSHGPDHVVKLDPSQGTTHPIVEGRAFQFGHDIVVKDRQTAFVVDGYAKAVWKVEVGQAPIKFAEGKPFKNPVGLSLSKQGLLVADPHRQAIFRISETGEISRFAPR